MTKRKTSVIGFPRIGKKRELKFASESFFKGDITEGELRQVAADLRRYGWKKQKDAGITFIPSNDFSFYDNVLDTAFIFGVVPARYRNLGLGRIETYFAASHGYQGEKGDVKALPMKKWFNTNYHYIEPEIDDTTVFTVNDYIKPVEEYNEAKAAGYQTVPVLTGSFTFLSLARYTGSKRAKDFAIQAAEAYAQVALKLAEAGAEWVSFAEPSLVLELNNEQRNLFKAIYSDLISRIRKESGLKILLQTYFGDIREAYADVIELGFDGIGLDFIEGRKTLELIQGGFPKDVLLFAGIVNGKNIWRANYTDKLELLKEIEKVVPADNIVIGTSCSLLHVPYTVGSEEKLSEEILRHFAFAEEKLPELQVPKTYAAQRAAEGNTVAAAETSDTVVRYTEEQVDSMVVRLKAQSFDSDRLALAKVIVASAATLTADQIARLARVIDFSNSQVDFLKYAFHYCADPVNYTVAVDVLTFTSDKRKVLDYVAAQR